MSAVDEVLNWFVKTTLPVIMAFAVGYIRDIGKETRLLSDAVIQMRLEVRNVIQAQSDFNLDIRNKLDSLDKRLLNMERVKK